MILDYLGGPKVTTSIRVRGRQEIRVKMMEERGWSDVRTGL